MQDDCRATTTLSLKVGEGRRPAQRCPCTRSSFRGVSRKSLQRPPLLFHDWDLVPELRLPAGDLASSSLTLVLWEEGGRGLQGQEDSGGHGAQSKRADASAPRDGDEGRREGRLAWQGPQLSTRTRANGGRLPTWPGTEGHHSPGRGTRKDCSTSEGRAGQQAARGPAGGADPRRR